MHADRFATGDFVVVAEQVQNAVDEQRLQLFWQRMPAALRLARGGLNRNHHVAQKSRLQCVGERKGKYISRLVLSAILAIQAVNLRVRHQRETEFRLRLVEVRQCSPHPLA